MATVLKALELGAAKTLLLLPKTRCQRREVRTEHPAACDVAEADKASTYDFVNNQVLLIQKSAVEVLQNTFKN